MIIVSIKGLYDGIKRKGSYKKGNSNYINELKGSHSLNLLIVHYLHKVF